MVSIQIDQELYRYLQVNAIAYVETPCDTLKRLLGLTGSDEKGEGLMIAETNPDYLTEKSKKKKTNLPQLIRSGKLKEGEKLIFRDYRGNQYPKYEITLSKGELKWQSGRYSMSGLARLLLKELGHNNDFVRGPVFFITSKGQSIAELWDEYLDETSSH
ncbi:hypothetical protein [Chitinophaga qingshengii]|uniref:Negative modulator of initiation of replication SeqA N-terminal domain-containing protein n=1 Tax=Chitinophaga qingshengii TaxID=1569794 RepID=A0ABR7TU62_9BACT|nr:hypothetical protein [Chitinophaga qingshengii]MBC9932939.1 hypothetical protein [Chitinophaga qingshengii]